MVREGGWDGFLPSIVGLDGGQGVLEIEAVGPCVAFALAGVVASLLEA